MKQPSLESNRLDNEPDQNVRVQSMVQVSPAEGMDSPSSPSQKEPFLQRVNRAVNGRIERAFDWLGHSIAHHPWVYIGIAVFWAAALGSGVRLIKNETRCAGTSGS